MYTEGQRQNSTESRGGLREFPPDPKGHRSFLFEVVRNVFGKHNSRIFAKKTGKHWLCYAPPRQSLSTPSCGGLKRLLSRPNPNVVYSLRHR